MYATGIMTQTDPEREKGDKLKSLAQQKKDENCIVIPPFEDYLQISDKQTLSHKSVLKVAAELKSQMSYQEMDHSVFLVGWGVDEKTKTNYWIVRNSYGDQWGMHGDFFVHRGQNDFGMESELSSYEVESIE